MSALIYCRVSTEEQAREGYSLDAQEKLCRHFAEAHGYAVRAVYRDEGRSGTTLNRPALQDLLAECQQNQDVQAVIVQETDRLARNTRDHLTIRMVLKKANVLLISVNQPMLDDSPEGNMVDTILASVNQFQSDLNARKVRKALQQKFETGWWPCRAPLGYKSVPVGGETDDDRRSRKIIVRDEATWPLVREGFTLYLTGTHSLDAVNDALYTRGLRSRSGGKLAHSMMATLLRNAFYAGQITWNGETRAGRHEAMITLAEYERVLDILARHNQYACRRRKHHFLLRGFLYCGICGQRFTAETRPRKRKSYYHCVSRGAHSNGGQNVETHILEEQVTEHFRTIQLDQALIDRALVKFQELATEQQIRDAAERQALWNKRKAVVTTRDHLEERLLKGVLDDEAFTRLRSKVQVELIRLDARLRELEAEHDSDVDLLRTALELIQDIYAAYQHAPDDLKHQYLAVFWERFLVRDRHIIEAVPTKLVRALEEVGGMVHNGVILTVAGTTTAPKQAGSKTREMLTVPPAIRTLFSDRAYMASVRAQLALLSQAMKSATA